MANPLQLKKPLVVFDLETTGLDFKYDRVIEIGAIKVHPDGRRETLLKKINPGMRISAEITALTGISNEDVAKSPSFADAAGEICSFFEGCDVAGYNLLRFDAKVLIEEFKRAGLDFKMEGRLVVDAQVIFHQKEKRDLSAAYKFYCNKELKGAHSANADTEATLEILLAQIQRYPDLPKDVEGLNTFCRVDSERFVDGEGKFFWRDGEAVFNFGKYKSQNLRTVVDKDPGYLSWVMSPDRHFSQEVVDICYQAQRGAYPTKK